MQKDGIVVNVENGMAKVAVSRTSGCGGGCKTCGGCDTPQVFVDLPNHLNAKLGDTVKLRSNNSRLMTFTMLVYLVPLVLLVASITIAYSFFSKRGFANYELLSFAVGILSFAISAIFLKFLDKKIKKSQQGFMVIDQITGNIAN